MRANNLILTGLFCAALMASGCQQRSVNPPVETEQQTAAMDQPADDAQAPDSGASEPAVEKPGVFWADALQGCDGAQIATIHWSDEAVAAGPAKIELSDGTVFAEVGGAGTKETGPWVAPGSVFVLKDATDGTERARVTLKGPATCP